MTDPRSINCKKKHRYSLLLNYLVNALRSHRNLAIIRRKSSYCNPTCLWVYQRSGQCHSVDYYYTSRYAIFTPCLMTPVGAELKSWEAFKIQYSTYSAAASESALHSAINE